MAQRAASDVLFGYFLSGAVVLGIGSFVLNSGLEDDEATMVWFGLVIAAIGSVVLQIAVIAWGVVVGLRLHGRETRDHG